MADEQKNDFATQASEGRSGLAGEFVDFLKGAEDYKFRLGAEARRLATVAGEIP